MRVTADGYLCDAGEILMGVGGKILAPGSKGSKFGITAILFPRGVTIIDGGFSGFPSLETVVLPKLSIRSHGFLGYLPWFPVESRMVTGGSPHGYRRFRLSLRPC